MVLVLVLIIVCILVLFQLLQYNLGKIHFAKEVFVE